MSRDLSLEVIVRDLADHASKRIAQKAIYDLKTIDGGQNSGDDFGLPTVWDEVCVQVQGEQSVMWEMYVDTIDGVVMAHVGKLRPHEREAVWLQSSAADEWLYDDEDERDPSPVFDGDIVEHIRDKYVLKIAANWSGTHVVRYFERRDEGIAADRDDEYRMQMGE